MRSAIISSILISCFGLSSALADFVPPWDRSEYNATYHHYTYSAAPSPPTDGAPGGVYYPEAVHNNFGGIPSSWDTEYGGQGQWLTQFAGRTGVAAPAGTVGKYWVWLPNAPTHLYKDIYVQAVWSTQNSGVRPRLQVQYWNQPVYNITTVLEDEHALEDGWMYTRWHFTLFKSPSFEALLIERGCGGLYLDELIVDTNVRNTPEPASLLLLGLTALLIRRR